MLASPLQSALSPRRRGWILLVAIAATVMFSWTSISHLSKLVELQKLPPGMRELPQHDVALSMGGGTPFLCFTYFTADFPLIE